MDEDGYSIGLDIEWLIQYKRKREGESVCVCMYVWESEWVSQWVSKWELKRGSLFR